MLNLRHEYRALTCTVACLLASIFSHRELTAQTVQLPTTRVFSLDTTVAVPDQGSAYLGGIGRSSTSTSRRGPLSTSRAYGQSSTQGTANVSARIIDLDELDRELRIQTTPPQRATYGFDRSREPGDEEHGDNMPGKDNADSKSDTEKARDSLDKAKIATRAPDLNFASRLTVNEQPKYDYLATLSHIPAQQEISSTSLEDAAYYLEQARQAKNKGHWSAVEVYYGLAWKALPPNRRQAAIAHWNKPKLEPTKKSQKPNDSKKF
ncbi:MAG: hypothetical protein NTW52_13285 [Planctomycetota bacterium]|nr:hypothetical protein [Planctomycetota bacterium]